MEGESIHGVRGQPDFTSKRRFASSAFSPRGSLFSTRIDHESNATHPQTIPAHERDDQRFGSVLI